MTRPRGFPIEAPKLLRMYFEAKSFLFFIPRFPIAPTPPSLSSLIALLFTKLACVQIRVIKWKMAILIDCVARKQNIFFEMAHQHVNRHYKKNSPSGVVHIGRRNVIVSFKSSSDDLNENELVFNLNVAYTPVQSNLSIRKPPREPIASVVTKRMSL